MSTTDRRALAGDAAGPTDDERLVAALRRGDEAAFGALVDRYQGSLLRVAAMYVPSQAVAEEVVQETWIGVLRGLERFAGRSSFKTWLFSILLNQARRRGEHEARSVPFSALARPDDDPAEPAVEPDRFLPPGHEWAGHWARPPQDWSETPEDVLLSGEVRARIDQAVAELPASQREVIILRDIDGWTADEVCNVLGLSGTNQRVLLHRARSKVRRALERYLEGS